MPYEVQTAVFEGPFDLLLHLIVREQVDLYEVSISRIVDGYLAELARLQEQAGELDLDVATEFLLIAAILVELKSRRLLPGPDDVDLDEELALWEERDLLLARLLECKTFKDAARALLDMSDLAGLARPRRAGLEERFLSAAPDLLAGVTPEKLRAAFLRAVTPKPVPRVDLGHLTVIRASVTDAVEQLMRDLPRAGRTTFRRLTSGIGDRMELVVRFLALLELFKQGLVELEQAGSFGEIHVEWTGGGDQAARDAGALVGVDAYEG